MRFEVKQRMTIPIDDEGTFQPVPGPDDLQWRRLGAGPAAARVITAGALAFVTRRLMDMQGVENPYTRTLTIFFHGIKIGGFPIVLKDDPIPALR
jgi:hypothetical protein